jgi:hypothetical protein
MHGGGARNRPACIRPHSCTPPPWCRTLALAAAVSIGHMHGGLFDPQVGALLRCSEGGYRGRVGRVHRGC